MSMDLQLSRLKVEGVDDGELTEPVGENGLRALVEGNQNYNKGDKLEVIWNDVSVFTHTITGVEEVAGVHFYIEKQFIKLGPVKANYTLADDSGNVAVSPVSNFNVIAAT
ncbi:MAG: hypothetical protein WBH22_27345 [Pseudomonas mandelii]|uniref:hypothetical protein n=1 Tax=Pseudomonas TaxID=286 RepID=UPI002489418B|nr:hypothetical protein [Pseudomonas sp.]MDI1329580.1 hypothetical protein [Pseudomonas sp.]